MLKNRYMGPDKPNKGCEDGACNVRSCQVESAIWYNHATRKWYCPDCRYSIQFDYVNLNDWKKNYERKLGHPMFETRIQMEERLKSSNSNVAYMEYERLKKRLV